MSGAVQTAARPAPMWSALRGERGFQRLLAAQVISLHGDQIAAIALTFTILHHGGPTALGILLAAKIAALSVFSIVGGTFADRRSPRAVMLAANAISLASQGLTAAVLVTGHISLATVLPLQIVSSAATGAFRPAATAITAAIVSTERLVSANSLLGVTASIAVIVGPALGAVLLNGLGGSTALAVDAGTFGVAFLLVAAINAGADEREKPASRVPFRESLREGWGEVLRRRPILAMIAYFSCYQLFVTSTLYAIGPVRSDAIAGPRAWSYVLGGFGVGMIVGGFLAPHVTTTRPLRTAVLLSSALGLAFPVLALSGQLVVIAAVFALSGTALQIGNILWFATLQTMVPRDKLARVSSFDWFASTLARAFGLVLEGVLVTTLGTTKLLCVSAALLVVLTVVVVRRVSEEGSP